MGADRHASGGAARRVAAACADDGRPRDAAGLRRGELFALRWKSVNRGGRAPHGDEAVYEGAFGTPKTSAGSASRSAVRGDAEVGDGMEGTRQEHRAEALVFSTWSGKPISPNNVLRRWVFPACATLNLPNATWLTFRRTYASWAHDKGVPGKVVAQLMGHTNADVTLNVYTQVLDASLRTAVDRIGSELFTIVHGIGNAVGAKSLI